MGDSSAEIVKNVSRVIHYARKDIPTLEDVWAAEHNPGHTGPHIHGYLHAGMNDRLIHEGAFENAVRRVGVGRHWAMDTVTHPDATYFAYPMKALVSEDYEAERFLELNGSPKRRQLIHASRGFWRDGRGGPLLKNRAEAEVSPQEVALATVPSLPLILRITPRITPKPRKKRSWRKGPGAIRKAPGKSQTLSWQ